MVAYKLLLISWDYVSLPHGAIGWSAVSDCGISWPISTDFFSCKFEQLKYKKSTL